LPLAAVLQVNVEGGRDRLIAVMLDVRQLHASFTSAALTRIRRPDV